MMVIDETNKEYIMWRGFYRPFRSNQIPVEWRKESPNQAILDLQEKALKNEMIEYENDKQEFYVPTQKSFIAINDIYNSYRKTMINVLKENDMKDIEHPKRFRVCIETLVIALKLTHLEKDTAYEWIEYFYSRLINEKALDRMYCEWDEDTEAIVYRFS